MAAQSTLFRFGIQKCRFQRNGRSRQLQTPRAACKQKKLLSGSHVHTSPRATATCLVVRKQHCCASKTAFEKLNTVPATGTARKTRGERGNFAARWVCIHARTVASSTSSGMSGCYDRAIQRAPRWCAHRRQKRSKQVSNTR